LASFSPTLLKPASLVASFAPVEQQQADADEMDVDNDDEDADDGDEQQEEDADDGDEQQEEEEEEEVVGIGMYRAGKSNIELAAYSPLP